jgi:hypothetical protein
VSATDKETFERITAIISAAIGRPFPQANNPPSREELLLAASLCAGAAEMCGELAKAVTRWEAS